MPHGSAAAAPKTVGFTGDPFHDSFHGLVRARSAHAPLGLSWADDGAWMTRLPLQPHGYLDHVAVSILELEVPAGGVELAIFLPGFFRR
jgi:hypothetical protein